MEGAATTALVTRHPYSGACLFDALETARQHDTWSVLLSSEALEDGDFKSNLPRNLRV